MDRRTLLTALACLALAPRARAAAPAATVTFLAEATVAGDTVRLGEIAKVAASDPALAERLRSLDVGAAPLAGYSRTFLAASARVRLRAAGLRDDQVAFAGAEKLTVARAAEAVAAPSAPGRSPEPSAAPKPSAPIVRRGARVKVICRSGGVAIACTAEAQQDGALGQSIRVRNLNSLLDFTARVVGDDTLEMSF